MRGFACIALDNPKTPANVGAVMRAAHAFGAAQITVAGQRGHATLNRWLRAAANTTRAERHCPVFIADDPLAYRPHGTEVVAVDLVDSATSLPIFCHPQRALYVFGAEDATLGSRVLSRAQHRVVIPSILCLNLAAAVSIILYDRTAKRHGMNAAYNAERAS